MPRLIALAALLVAAPAIAAEPTSEQVEFFEKHVRPVFAENCFDCHGPDVQEAGLRLDSRDAILKGGETGPAVVPGNPAQSELILALSYDPDGYQMPPDGKLADEQIAAVTEWVRMGAPWPGRRDAPAAEGSDAGFDLAARAKHWSFQPVRRPAIPDVSQPAWPRTPVDAFILNRLDAAGLQPAAEADRRTLLRRATYDLIGLPPTADELDAFLNDPSPDAYERVVDRLLASPRYGERWARHWLDLVRFAETTGHEFDYEIPNAWQYRDYVVRALNADLRYDEFVVEHLAGDLLPQPRRDPITGRNESIVGTAFYWFGQGKHSPVDLRAEECERFDNQLDVLGKAFLGLTIACARCHDHKFDPITARDYYAMAGYLQSSRQQQAFLDAPEPRQRTIDAIAALIDTHRAELTASTQRAAHRAAEGLAERLLASASAAESNDTLKSRRDRAVGRVSDPLHPWAVLGGIADPARFTRRRDELLQQLRRTLEPAGDPSRITVFDDFKGNDFTGWDVTGQAFGTGPSRDGDLVLGTAAAQPVRELAAAGIAHSGLISDRLHGVLRSRTFTIEKPYIHYRVARRGGRASPGRSIKNGQIHLVVYGFDFIRDPLYGNLTLNIPQDEPPAWHRQDVSRFVGTQAFIEIEDEEPEGHIAVDRILFSDDSAPPKTANPHIVALLDNPQIISPQALAQGYEALFAPPARSLSGRRLESRRERVSDPAARLELVNWLLTADPLVPREAETNDDADPLADVAALYAQLEARLAPPLRAPAMADGTGENETLLIRGNPKKPGDEVPRRFLEVFGGTTPDASGSGRLELARRLTDPANPLSARVLVNRLWHHHFGRGLVPTVDDFGHMGQPPSHPELLDWLAAEFVDREPGRVAPVARSNSVSSLNPPLPKGGLGGLQRTFDDIPSERSRSNQSPLSPASPEISSRLAPPTPPSKGGEHDASVAADPHAGLTHSAAPSATDDGPRTTDNPRTWRLKRVHRLLVLSSAYRMSSAATDPRAEAADPQNRLLHRMSVRRLEAEAIRDALLAVSGRLDQTMYGPGVAPHLTPFMEGRGRPAHSGPLDGDGRRSLYVTVRRNFLTPLFLAFDFPTPFTTMGRRSVSNVPAQALTLMNNPLVVEQSQQWADRVLREPHRSRAARIERLYEMAYARPATPPEQQAALAFLDAQDQPDSLRAWADLCHVLINVKEFVFIQ